MEAELFWSAPERLNFVAERGSLTAVSGALARYQPGRVGAPLQGLAAGTAYATDGYTERGQQVGDSARWYRLAPEAGGGWVHSSGGGYAPAS